MNITPCRPQWKAAMTDRERFVRQTHYQPVDRCFNMEFGYWEDNYEVWPMFVENGIRTEAQANIYFNFDRIENAGGNIWLHPNFAGQIVEERESTRIVMNEDGVLAEVQKAGGGSSIPHFLKPSIVTPEDWQRVKEERLRRDDPARKVDLDAFEKKHPADRDYPVGVWVGSMIGKIRDMLTFEGLAFATYDYPEMVEEMVETSCVLVEDFLDQVLPRIQFDYAAGWEDICFNNGPIVSVDFFKNVVVPRYKRIGQKLHAAGIDIW
jgi:uroporphyrinogen decarboxylase